MNKPLIIIPFTLPWNWSADYQRQTILELSKRKFKIIAYMQDDAHFFLKRKKPKYPKVNNVTFYIPKYILPFRRFAWIEKLNKNISLLLFNLSIFFRKKIIWIFDQEFYSFHKLMINKISLYDCVDYHAENQKEYEEILINNTNFLFTNSHTLYELHKNKKNNCKLVVQGFNSSEFNKTIRKVRKIKNKKVIGFIGGINSRLNFKIILTVIKNNPKVSFEFWGPFQKNTNDKKYQTQKNIQKLKSFKNVSFNIARTKKELISAVSNFDIGIIPYDINQPFNLNCYPMKIFEYFYLGIPVISTPIKELTLDKFKDIVYIANTSDTFDAHIKVLLQKAWPKHKKDKQKMLALKNSWKNKVTQILSEINKK